jgi:hypothetical protein
MDFFVALVALGFAVPAAVGISRWAIGRLLGAVFPR